MENYKIIRNGDGLRWKYDFTLKNGLNLLVNFESQHATEHGAPTRVEVYDRDRNNITEQIVSAFMAEKRLSALKHQDEVHQLISYCKSLEKEEIRSALGFRQHRPMA